LLADPEYFGDWLSKHHWRNFAKMLRAAAHNSVSLIIEESLFIGLIDLFDYLSEIMLAAWNSPQPP